VVKDKKTQNKTRPRPKCPSKFVKRPWFKPMEGLVLPVTAFMSFASILWLVVAKLADSGVKDEAETTSTLAESNNDYDENVAVTVHSSSGNIQISAKNITNSRKESETKEDTHIWQMILSSNKTKHNG